VTGKASWHSWKAVSGCNDFYSGTWVEFLCNHFLYSVATFQVWENEIMDTDTWVEFVKKHKFSDFLEKQNLDENDLMIDVLLR